MELARLRPTTADHLRGVPGIGEKRLADLGPDLVTVVGDYCREHGVATNVGSPTMPSRRSGVQPDSRAGKPDLRSGSHAGKPDLRVSVREAAFLMFAQGAASKKSPPRSAGR